ncbi:retrovirus-related pol polyprotein from transposon TNT 1-94 [Tanacetum coccineum]
MSETVPPVPPPFGTNSGNPGSHNVNRVDMIPTTTDPINTTTTKNVSQKLLVFLDGLEPYLLKTLEDGPFVPMSSSSIYENPLPKRQNQWSNVESRLANQDKRLNSIIISCLPNDFIKSFIKCKTVKEMWNDLILAHEGPFDTRDTKIAALRLNSMLLNHLKVKKANNSIKNDCLAALYGKYNYEEGLIDQIYESKTQRFSIQASSSKALISNNQFQDSDSDVKEDQRTSNEFMTDLNDEESVSSKDKGTTRIRAFMAIAEDEPSVGKTDARSGQWVDITMKKVHRLLSMIDGDERKHVLDYTHVDLHYVEDQRKNLLNKFNLLKQELSLHKSELLPSNIINALGGKGRRKENNFSKEVIFTKADESSSELALEITSDFEIDCDTQGPLPALPKLIGAEPSGTSNSLISLSDLTSNMAELTLNNTFKKSKKSSDKVSQTYVMKKTEPKGIKDHIKIPSVTSPSGSQASSYKPSKQKDYLKRVAYVNGLKHNLISISQLYEYSRYTWVFCLKKKSDAAECIMSFIKKMENLNEVRVNELRSDNGTEFRNHKLEEFYDEKGISRNFLSPCTPEQNGVAERRNKTLIEAARTMLNSAKLPKQFWGEAINTACYT